MKIGKGDTQMAVMDWFKDEFIMTREFSVEVAPIIVGIEAYETKIEELKKSKEELKLEIGKQVLFESKKEILEHMIKSLEKTNIKEVEKLKAIKDRYLAEEFLDTLETLAGVDEGEEISDEACKLLMKINNLDKLYLDQAARNLYS